MKHFYKKLFILLLVALVSFSSSYAQVVPNNQDCLGAIPICQGVYVQNNSYVGTGNIPNEINAGISCLLSGEKNDVWYVFTVQTSGILNFTITPNNLADDYDWAVYNLTNHTCAQIATTASIEVSCNYSGLAGPTGPNGLAGAQNNPPFAVTAGQTYVLNVSNFSSTQSGYTFDVGATTATIFDASPPYLKEIVTTPAGAQITCGLGKITAKFSENIHCNSLDTLDLAIKCPNNIQHKITAVQCKSTGAYSNLFDITVFPAFTDSGKHALYLTRFDSTAITDLCNNPAISNTSTTNDTVPFVVKGLLKTMQQTNVNCFGDSTGFAKINPSNGTSPYLYSWLTTPVKTSQSISQLKAGYYTCIVKDAKGCSIRDSVLIVEKPQLAPTVVASWDTCGKGTGIAVTSITGGTPPYYYKWDDAFQQTTATATNLREGNYSVTIRDSLNCDTVLDVAIITAPIVRPEFDYEPKALSLFSPDCNFTDLSQNAVSWFWDFGDGDTAMSQNPFHKFEKDGTFPVKLVIENSYGCQDSAIVDVYVDGFYTLYLPTSFSPNGDGKNDVFKIQGSGLISDKFELNVFARNGQIIYKTNDIEKGWDGTVNGKQVPADAYVLDINFMDYKFVEHRKKSVITIIR
jgi:gliding motility-associated-like protein